MSSSNPDELGVPRSSDGAPNWAADTDPVGPVIPEPAFVDPGATQTQLQREVSMSTADFGNPNLGQAPVPAPATDGLISPLTLSAAAPVEPLAQPAPLAAPQLAPAAPVEAPAPAIPVSDMRDVPLGTLIFRAGLLTEEQLEEALQDGMQRGKRLGEVLLERGLVSEGDLGRLLAGQKGLRFVELDSAAIDPAAVQLLPVEKARLHSVLPIGFQDGLPVVAVADPSNDLVVENVRRALNCEPHLVVAGREALHRQIEVAYETVSTAAVPVVAQEVPVVAVAPVVPTPEPVVQVAPAEPPPVAEAVEPLPVAPAQPVNGEGVWLGTPEATFQVEPNATQAPELQPLVVEAVAPVAVTPFVETPVVQQPVPEPLAISYTPVAPVEQPVIEPLAPLPAAEPVVAAEPVIYAEPVVAAEPVVVPEPVVAPPILAHEPLLAPEPVPPEPVVPAPAPLLEQPASEQDADTVVTWSVVLRLADGDRVEIGAFHSSGEAKELAQNVVRQIASNHGWPFFAGRFIRPEAIISVDLAEPEGRWLGSAARRQAWTAGEQS